MLRFVLLRHECPAHLGKPSHWDFMLEAEETLLTWELRQLPTAWLDLLRLDSADTSEVASATRLEDHRLAYLDYEGPITGDRGTVRQVDRGNYQLLEKSEQGYAITLHGARLTGKVTMRREGNSWQIGHAPEEHSSLSTPAMSKRAGHDELS